MRTAARLCIAIALVALASVHSATGAVIGIDAGSQFFKIAIAVPGKGFEIVPDEQTQRKFPAIITFDEHGERLYGNSASSLALRRPTQSYSWMRDLLGKPAHTIGTSIDQPCNSAAVLKAASHLPHQFESTVRGSVAVRRNATAVLTIEEIQAMLFGHVKSISTSFAGSDVKDAVITVPTFFSQKERRAVIDAAELAGLNVLGLINENTAFVLQYAINYDFNPNKTAHAIFYNMGASATQVSLFRFSAEMVKGKIAPRIETLATAWNETLGGMSFDSRIVDHLVDVFSATLKKKAPGSPNLRTLPRVMARLLSTANRAKEVLSANKEASVYAESLHADVDLVTMMNQEQFHKLTADLFEYVTKPLESILEQASMTASQIDHFVLVGGGTRIPRIQSALKQFMNRESLDQNLNGDEAGAFGAVFHAADLHPAFRVRQMALTEIASLPIGMRFADVASTVPVVEGDESGSTKGFAKRVALLRRNSALGKKISVAFSHDADMQCSAFYDSAELLPISTSVSLGQYRVSGLAKVVSDKAALLTSSSQTKPKVAVTFQMSSSGLLELISAEATIEESIKELKPKPIKKENSTDSENATDAKTDAKTEEASQTPVADEWVWRNKTHRFTLTVSGGIENADLRPMNSDEKAASLHVLKNMAAVDAARRALADSRNALESFIYGTREKLLSEEVVEVTNEQQRSELTAGLDAASEWLSQHEFDQDPAPFRSQLAPLKDEFAKISLRVKEALDRPAAVDDAVFNMKRLKRDLKWISNNMSWVPEADVKALEKDVERLDKWLNEKISAQTKLSKHESPAFMAAEVGPQVAPVVRFAERLMKIPKPTPKPTPKPSAKGKDKESKDGSGDAKESAATDAKESETKDTDSKEAQTENKSDASSQNSEPHAEAKPAGQQDEL